MYWKAVFLFLTWPLIIVVSLFAIQYVLNRYKDILEQIDTEEEPVVEDGAG